MKQLLRSFLRKHGYVLWNRDYFRFGISPFVDLARLNAAWGRPLHMVFDVGANIGEFANEARQEWPAAEIHCFEPHPRTFERLSQAKPDSRMFQHCLAFSDEVGEATFYEYGSEGDGTLINSLIPDAQGPTRFGYKSNPIKVRGSTVDHFCAARSIDRIDFLKIDVEGAELSVLKGSRRLLEQQKIIAVYLEFNSVEVVEGAQGGALAPMARYLGDFGLRYACTYTDSMLLRNDLFVIANALFVLPPRT